MMVPVSVINIVFLIGIAISSVSCSSKQHVSNDDGNFKAMVIAELNELKGKVAELENENQLLKQHNERSKRQAVNSFIPEHETGFSASVSQHIKNLTAHQSIIFGNVLTNLGNYYNNSTGVFYVPVSGTYMFFVNILSESDNSIETELIRDGHVLAEIYSGAGKFHGAGSNFVIVSLNRGNNVWVKVHAQYSTDMSVHCCWSTFSGYLLREYETQTPVVG